ncbi:ferritin-like fold-containing protein [Micromonospora sp. SL4-19]|uniref:ferritin-like fold-containing protein n=1 Tax=Micromonospora sp. SL4-19 TaxID=3399129 RepID=UPI003A4DBEF5
MSAPDPALVDRLYGWARRLVGEAFSQDDRVATADRGDLTALIAHRIDRPPRRRGRAGAVPAVG